MLIVNLGFVHNFHGLLVCRFFLGAFEGEFSVTSEAVRINNLTQVAFSPELSCTCHHFTLGDDCSSGARFAPKPYTICNH